MTGRRHRSDPSATGQAHTDRGWELLFLAPGDVRKGRVEPISWMRTCSAFAERGIDVSLAALSWRMPDAIPLSEVWSHFGVRRSFRIRLLPTTLGRDSSTLAFRLSAGSAATALALQALVPRWRRPSGLIVYARSPIMMAPFAALRGALPRDRRPQLVFETHSLPDRRGARIARMMDLVVVSSSKLERDVTELLGLPPERVLHAPLGPYNETRRHPRGEARSHLGLPPEAPLACYTGKLLEDQNEFLLRTSALLRSRVPGFRLVLVGGNPRILDWTRRRLREMGLEESVILPGFVEPSRVDLYQSAADVLVFHMSSDLLHFEYCTPAKGFEYQAAGRPIVATDIPLFEEVFGKDGERALRVRERTPAALAGAIETALRSEEAPAMARRAAQAMSDRSWESRATAVLGALDV
jgi:glycosyltransferase involved in cell wall biosynthesis